MAFSHFCDFDSKNSIFIGRFDKNMVVSCGENSIRPLKISCKGGIDMPLKSSDLETSVGRVRNDYFWYRAPLY